MERLRFVVNDVQRPTHQPLQPFLQIALMLVLAHGTAMATPANKKAAANHFEHFLPAKLTDCTLCHLPSSNHAPESLEEFPHNGFGKELAALGKKTPLPERLQQVANADSDADGVPNLAEILLGGHPGDAKVKPDSLAGLPEKEQALATFLKRYAWEPFKPVKRPALPSPGTTNPIDAFINEQLAAHNLKPLGEAAPAQLADWPSLPANRPIVGRRDVAPTANYSPVDSVG